MAAVGLLLLVVAVCAGLLLYRDRPPADEPVKAPPVVKPSYRLLTELYAIRRRLDAAQFKFDVRRDAADARHRLRAELRELECRERRQP